MCRGERGEAVKNRVIKVAVPIGLLVLCVAIVLLVGAGARKGDLKDEALIINGSPVFEEEFFLLLRENTIQYENQLREDHKIPGGQSVRAYFDGDETEYRRLLLEENIAHLTELRVEQALAKEYGVASEFTYAAFLEELDTENRRRADSIAKGEPVYGLQSFSPEQYYSYKMSNLRTQLLRALPDKLLAVTDEEVLAYYKGLEGYAHLEGERIYYTLYDVTGAATLPPETQERLYSEIQATLTEKTNKEISVGSDVYRPEKQVFTPNELRNFVKQSFDGEFLLSLATDEVSEVFTLGGSDYIAQYNGFDKAETLADNEKGVFRAQLQERAYENLIAQKAEQADVQVNQAKIMKEEKS